MRLMGTPHSILLSFGVGLYLLCVVAHRRRGFRIVGNRAVGVRTLRPCYQNGLRCSLFSWSRL